MTYNGWKIRIHKGKIPKAKREVYWHNIKTCFNAENVDFSDDDHKITVYDAQYHQFIIRTSFLDNSVYGYEIESKSQALGRKRDETKAHQNLYYTTMTTIAKIRGQRQSFWLEDNKEILIPKTKVLRTRHRHILHKCSVPLDEIIKNRAVPLRR